MRRVIVGTAGHIDHGKTKLIEAITGIDCDRWEEERRRGITIDIGFAHLVRDDLQIGFIDVPGHERFLHNALAGLGGIRVMLLVVAADQGVEPQTLEHLDICRLLAIPRALVALTKSDLVTGDLLELARLEVEELIAASPWPDARVLAASSTSGEGVVDIVDEIVRLAGSLPEEHHDEGIVRLPIDRAFQLRGLGSIVTGTLVSGRIEVGAVLDVAPAPRSGPIQAKVRSIEVHGLSRQVALAGERTAVQLAGVGLGDLERGQQLVEPSSLAATTSLLVEAEILAAAPIGLEGWTDVQVHLYSSEVRGRIRPLEPPEVAAGSRCFAEVRLAAPLVAVRGDRFVFRRLSPAATLGGGVVLDPAWRRPRAGARRRSIEALSGSEQDAARHWVDTARLDGLEAAELARLSGRRPGEAEATLESLARDGRLTRVDPGHGRAVRWIAPRHFAELERRAGALLAEYLEARPLAAGMPRAEAARRLLPGAQPELVKIYFDWLDSRRILVQSGDQLNLPGREAQPTGEESALARRLLAAYDEAALQPQPPAEVAASLGAKPHIVDGLIHFLVQQGSLVRLGGGLVISSRALDGARRDLLASGLDDFTVAEFKDRFGLSRKWAIPILEHFDAQRVTHRLGDRRKLVRDAPVAGSGESGR
jgi:selenocysteine-specific elongation factor